MPLTWAQTYSVGIDILDQQHGRMVNLIASLQKAMSEGQGNAVLDQLFNQLADYACVHFTTEEQFMQDAGYPLADTHHVQHRRLLGCLDAMQERHLSGAPLVSVEVLDFLLSWLAQHIQGHDVDMARYVVSVRKKPRLALMFGPRVE